MGVRVVCVLLPLVVACNNGPHDGRTGNAIVDACLHWTACATPPFPDTHFDFADCATFAQFDQTLPWRGGGVTITPAQRDCLAAAGLDCDAALDCVTTPASCDQPTWSCDGDTLAFCDAFSGPRTVTRDCAAAGLHCVILDGKEAFCGLGACDPRTFTPPCAGSAVTYCQPQIAIDGTSLPGLIIAGADCSDDDATCVDGQCVGNGAVCTPSGGNIRCDGNAVVFCDVSGHEERNACPDGTTCGPSLGPGGAVSCFAAHRGDCIQDAGFEQCHGDSLEYCDDHGNETLDCKSLGYAGCDSGRCVPR